MKNLTPALLIAFILGCGLWLFYWNASKPAPGETVAHMQPLACASCGKAYADKVGDPPVECRFCGERAVWRAQKCAKCDAVFPMIRQGATEGAKREGVACTKCGSTRFGDPLPEDLSPLP